MKPKALLLALSVAANAALVGCLVLRVSAPPPVEPAVRPVAKAAGGISNATKQLLVDDSTAGLEQLRDQLLAEGLPMSAVEAIIEDRLWRSRQARIDKANPLKNRPWWQQTEDQLPGDDLHLNRLSEALRSESQAEMRRLFPHRDSPVDARRIAFLPPGKAAAVQELMQDYEELRSNLRAKVGDPWLFKADSAQWLYLRDEEERDVRALLTPIEYEQFKLRDPNIESRLKRAAAIVGFSEREFYGMRAISEWRSAQASKFPYLTDPFASVSPEQRAEEQRLNEEAARRERELLGLERFTFYVYSSVPDYDQMARYAARYDLPPSRIMEYLALKDNAMAAVQQITAKESTPEQRRQAVKSWIETTKKSLNDLVGSNPSEGLELDELIQRADREAPRIE